jgi:hypothetical protein
MRPDTKSAIHIPCAATIGPAQDHPARPVESTTLPGNMPHARSFFDNSAAAKILDHPPAKKLEERLLVSGLKRSPLTSSKPTGKTMLADTRSSSRKKFCSHAPQWIGLAASPARSTSQTHLLDLASCLFPTDPNRQQPPQQKTESRLSPRALVEYLS